MRAGGGGGEGGADAALLLLPRPSLFLIILAYFEMSLIPQEAI